MSGDLTYVHVASVARREKFLRQVILDLLHQCDHIFVYLNDYEDLEPPEWLKEDKITVWMAPEGDLGDAGKFYRHEQEGYHVIVDDDFYYPPDYVEWMVSRVKAYRNKYGVSLLGRVLGPRPMKSYYRKRTGRYWRWDTPHNCDEWCHIGGTGVFAYHSSAIKIELDDFKKCWPQGRNMADIWNGIKFAKENVPIVRVFNRVDWLKDQPVPREQTIYGTSVNNDSFQTRVCNEAAWPEIPDTHPIEIKTSNQ